MKLLAAAMVQAVLRVGPTEAVPEAELELSISNFMGAELLLSQAPVNIVDDVTQQSN
jgi:hypothetical protein